MIILTFCLVAMLAVGALAYRLSRGPLQIPWIAAKLANAVSGTEVRIDIGTAELAWAGYKSGSGAPLILQLGDIAVRDAGGALLAAIPQAQLGFSPGAIFTAQAPIRVSGQNADVMGWNAPVSLLAAIRLGGALKLQSAEISVTLGPGQFGPPGFDEPLAGGKFLLLVTPRDIQLIDGVLSLRPSGHSAPIVHLAGSAHRSDSWRGSITLGLDAMQAGDLATYWPPQLAPITRGWVTRNVTAGAARNASFTIDFTASPNLATLRLEDAQGGFAADALTVTWLQGALPLTGVSGPFVLTDRNDIDITANIGHLGGITLTGARMHITGLTQPLQTASLQIPVSGTVQDALAVLNGPRLRLLQNLPPVSLSATGDMTGTVQLALPLMPSIPISKVKLAVVTVVRNATLPLPVQGLALRQGQFTFDATLRNLRLKGNGSIAGQQASVTSTAQFAATTRPAVVLDIDTTATAETVQNFGWNPGSFIRGAVPVHVHLAVGAHSGSLTVDADLAQAALQLPVFGWTKPAGMTGNIHLAASIGGNRSAGIDRIDSIAATAPGLEVETAMIGNAIELSRVHIGSTEGAGRIDPPDGNNRAWRITLAGNALDLSAIVKPPRQAVAANHPGRPGAAQPRSPGGFVWQANLNFGRLILAARPEPDLQDFSFHGEGQGNDVFAANASALVDAGAPVTLSITPAPGSAPGQAETMQVQTDNAGELLRAFGAFNNLSGGRLALSASYGMTAPPAGLIRLTRFRLLQAPALGKILQAMTVLGIAEAASGPGLEFDRLVAPFSINAADVMTLNQSRAYSAALGFTASGTIDPGDGLYDLHGTVVPAYALNTLPGKIPLIGKLFSPEKGGGLFAMRYTITGPFADPKVTINPFSALTPGFLRGIFGLGNAVKPP